MSKAMGELGWARDVLGQRWWELSKGASSALKPPLQAAHVGILQTETLLHMSEVVANWHCPPNPGW